MWLTFQGDLAGQASGKHLFGELSPRDIWYARSVPKVLVNGFVGQLETNIELAVQPNQVGRLRYWLDWNPLPRPPEPFEPGAS